MDIKFAREGRVAQYGIALGVLLYAVWRGLGRFFVLVHLALRHPRGWHGTR